MIDGDIRFYNWITLAELEHGFKADLEKIAQDLGLPTSIVSPVVEQFKEIIASDKYLDYKYTYNGKDYYNFSILQYDASVLGFNAKSNGKITKGQDFNSANVYSNISIEGTIKVMDGVANVDFVIDALTISGKNPFIKPGQSHESAINNIRQDERIYA